jgi:hypothetical protein
MVSPIEMRGSQLIGFSLVIALDMREALLIVACNRSIHPERAGQPLAFKGRQGDSGHY